MSDSEPPGGKRFARSLPTRRQPLQAAQDESRPPLWIVSVIEPQLGQPAQQGRDGDFRLDACELGTETMVNPAAEGQGTYIGTGDIEAIGMVVIGRRVAVG